MLPRSIPIKLRRNGRGRRRRSVHRHQHRCRRKSVRVPLLGHVRLGMLLEVIAAAKLLSAGLARVRPDSGVDALVAGQLLVPGEGLAAGRFVALERALSCRN